MQRNVLEYLDASARRVPDKIAFADDQTSVTFGALSRQAQGLGTWLARHTGAVNVPVAVFIDRTAQSITAMQGVLYAGCCYGQYILGKPANGLGNRAIYQPAAS